jgi:hypothetical protein
VEGMHIDITTVVAIWMGGAILLVPLLALALRFGLPPVLEAVAELRRARVDRPAEERMARMEARLARLAEVVERLAAAERARVTPFS